MIKQLLDEVDHDIMALAIRLKTLTSTLYILNIQYLFDIVRNPDAIIVL